MRDKLSKDGSKYVTDEVFNSSSHLVGSIFALLGTALLVVQSCFPPKPWHIISFSIYGLSLFLVFFASSLHHGVNSKKRIEFILRQADYLAIFPLIAGTFTPICLLLLRNPFGWAVVGVVWIIAIIGITLKSIFPNMPKWVTSTMYISMGWLGIVLAFPFYRITGLLGLLFLVSGAFFYSIGFIIYNIEKPNLIEGKFGFHEIWHIFVLLGALSHYLMMYIVVFPR